jgi:hypothetical protein
MTVSMKGGEHGTLQATVIAVQRSASPLALVELRFEQPDFNHRKYGTRELYRVAFNKAWIQRP